MATTKIWTISEGSKISQVIRYVTNDEKTVMRFEINTETPMQYSYEEMMQFQDVIDASMQDANIVNVISYAADDAKTEEKRFVSAINCTVEHCREEMLLTKAKYHKKKGILLWHGYQSFKPGEVTAEEAHRIGVKLADNLWGNDYEVLVCTHLDKQHIHNHFVVNSVSFRTGKKLDVRWIDMARESDRLCKEYNKSIIEHPKGKGMHYKAYMDGHEGKSTWISVIKDEVDAVIVQSKNINDFIQRMKSKGYELKLDGKYFALKPPGKERFVRLDRRLGEQYALVGIGDRIEQNNQYGRYQRESTTKVYRCKNRVAVPKKKLHGYQALYVRYCYMLGIIPKRKINAGKINYLYHEEITKMHQIRRQTHLLLEKDIHTRQELKEEQFQLKQDLRCYKEEKKRIQSLSAKTPEEKNVLSEKVKDMNQKIKKLYRDIKTIDGINQYSVRLQEKVAEVSRLEQGKGDERAWKEAEKQK